MLSLIQKIPYWKDVWEGTRRRSSIIAHVPRHHGERQFVNFILQECEVDEFTSSLQINPLHYNDRGNIDYSSLWITTKKQLRIRSRKVVKDQDSYENAFGWLIGDLKGDLMVIVTGAGRGYESLQCQAVTLFHKILIDLPQTLSRHISVLVLDDYSLRYFEEWPDTSGWDNFSRVYFQSLSLDQIASALADLHWGTDGTENLPKVIHDLTGGHIGLILEFVEMVSSGQLILSSRGWEKKALDRLGSCSIVESIRLRLEENPHGLTEKALNFKEPAYPRDSGDPDIQFLRQIGVLQWISGSQAILCKGVVSRLVDDINKSSVGSRPLGTLISDLGPKVYLPFAEELVASDRDFVVLHLSDIHVGSKFPFRLPEVPSSEAKQSIEKLLIEDIRRINLSGRIDALIVSGDFTEAAQIAEFDLARRLLGTIVEQIEMQWSQVIFIPGNHDVEWHGDELRRPNPQTGASRVNYDIFRRLLSKPEYRDAELIQFPSVDNRRCLRILTLDTNFVEGPESAGIGYISQGAFEEGKHQLEQAIGDYEETLTWIVVHHHVFPASSHNVEEARRRRVSMIANVSDLLSHASIWGAEIILHGHEHQPSVTVARRWPSDLRTDFEPLISVGAGSFGAPKSDLGSFGRNHYYIIIRRESDIVIRSRHLSINGLAFEPHSDLLLPR